jgi:hypothetical protein
MVSEFEVLNERGENHQSSGDCRNAKLNTILGLTVANAMDSR